VGATGTLNQLLSEMRKGTHETTHDRAGNEAQEHVTGSPDVYFA
jgi:hypothetical protein